MGAGVKRSEALNGARFGAYEIVALIGHGATASVFEAKHVALGKPVAIKLLHEHLASDEQIATRFVREGRVVAKLRHPNAIEIVDAGVEDGAPYLVMELLHGQDLRALLADVAPLSVEHALVFLLPVASALAHAHDAGILHRDLKPANIFLARDVRDDVVPKLVDFGLSKVIVGDAEGALTRSELVAGTVLYMAPEQTLGVRHSSPRSDEYSLAAVLYECITGMPPFVPEGTVYDVIERVRTTSPRPPSARVAALPPALDAVVLRAMAHEPGARYETVRAFARELLPFADEATRRTFERDFQDRPSGSETASSRRSALRARSSGVVAASAETRTEITAESSALRPIAPLPCPAGSGPFHIKGLFYKGFLAHVVSTVGLDALCGALPDDALVTFIRQPFMASTRYDIFPFLPLSHALAGLLGMRLDAYLRTTTIAQARYDAKHVYKLIFDLKDPADLADRVARFNTQIYDFGTFSGRIPQPNHLEVTFGGIPLYMKPWFGPMYVAYAEESLRMGGAKEVTIIASLVDEAGNRHGYPLVTLRTEMRWR